MGGVICWDSNCFKDNSICCFCWFNLFLSRSQSAIICPFLISSSSLILRSLGSATLTVIANLLGVFSLVLVLLDVGKVLLFICSVLVKLSRLVWAVTGLL
jgi:hypothetical protein